MKPPSINTETETKKITTFIRNTLKKEGFKKVVIGVSGGIDSTTSLYLLSKSIEAKNIFPINLYYFKTSFIHVTKIFDKLKIPLQNRSIISIRSAVDEACTTLEISPNDKSQEVKIRLGNIMARMRMIFLYDFAKKYNAIVCGTENKSEELLAYFTRFGDEASDIEPIKHLYKTQIFQLAKHLKIPKEIIKQKPTAGLWHGQTDEEEFGFTYKEADSVLYLYFEQNKSVKEITKQGFKNAEKVIKWVKKNSYKHHVPYTLES